MTMILRRCLHASQQLLLPLLLLLLTTSTTVVTGQFDDSDYEVNVYECDEDLKELKNDQRMQRIQGSLVRMCFVPSKETLDAGIGIESILSFVWRTNYGEEDGIDSTNSMIVQEAVRNGEGDGVLSAVTCGNDGTVCVLDSMLPTKMYVDTGSIFGDGYVTLTNNAGIVPVKRDIFHTSDEYFGEKVGQCLSDTTSMEHSNPELKAATQKYQDAELQNGVSGGLASMYLSSSLGAEGRVEEVIVGSTLSISVPPEEVDVYKYQCSQAGGIPTELPDTVVLCPFFNQISKFQMIDGVSCLANTTECNETDTFDVLIDAYAVLGFSGCRKEMVTAEPTATPGKPTSAPTASETEEIELNIGKSSKYIEDKEQAQSLANTNAQNIIANQNDYSNNNNNNNGMTSLESGVAAAKANMQKQQSQSSGNTGTVVGIVVAVLVLGGLAGGFFVYRKRRASTGREIGHSEESEEFTNSNQGGGTMSNEFTDDHGSSNTPRNAPKASIWNKFRVKSPRSGGRSASPPENEGLQDNYRDNEEDDVIISNDGDPTLPAVKIV